MARAKVTNNAVTTLAAGITAASTTLAVAAGGGSLFPATGYFYATLLDASNIPEIIKVTARNVDVFTIERAKDNTSARAFATGSRIALQVVAVVINELAATTEPVQFDDITTFKAAVPTTGTLYFGNTATKYLGWDGTNFNLSAPLVVSGNVSSTSDERVKTNWRDLPQGFVQKLADVKVGVYERTDTYMTEVGVSAQSLQTLLPNSVTTDNDGMLSVAYGQAALAACVMLAREVATLKAKLQALTE